MKPGTLLKVNLCYSDIGDENFIVLTTGKNCYERLNSNDIMIFLSEELGDRKKLDRTFIYDTLKVITTKGVGWVYKDEVEIVK